MIRLSSVFNGLEGARRWFRGRLYVDQLGRNLPRSLALGGILHICARDYFLPTYLIEWSLLGWPLAVVGVPLITALLMDNETRVCQARRFLRKKPQIALFYFVFHLRKPQKKIRKDIEYINSLLKNTIVRKNKSKKIKRKIEKLENT